MTRALSKLRGRVGVPELEPLYLDTGVIVARYKPGDPIYTDSRNLSERRYSFYISHYTFRAIFGLLEDQAVS